MMRALPRCAVALAAALMLIASPALANMALESYPVRHEATVDLTRCADHIDWAFFTANGGIWLYSTDATKAWAPYESGALVPDTKDGVLLFAVRRDRLAELKAHALRLHEAQAGEVDSSGLTFFHMNRATPDSNASLQNACYELLAKGVDWIAVSDQRLGGRSFGYGGDGKRVTRTDHILTDIRGNRIVLDGLALRHDGEPMTVFTPMEVADPLEERKTAFLLLGSVGLLGLGFVIVRRARARPDAG